MFSVSSFFSVFRARFGRALFEDWALVAAEDNAAGGSAAGGGAGAGGRTGGLASAAAVSCSRTAASALRFLSEEGGMFWRGEYRGAVDFCGRTRDEEVISDKEKMGVDVGV